LTGGAAWGKTDETFTSNLPPLNVNGNITPPPVEATEEYYNETDWDSTLALRMYTQKRAGGPTKLVEHPTSSL
jgi:hypothetical protein